MTLFSHKNMFYFGIFIKILCSICLLSSYLEDLFIPFVDSFVSNIHINPYSSSIYTDNKASFPYPALMLYILAIPKMLLGWLPIHSPFFSSFIYRIPLFIADISIFLILKSWLKQKYHARLLCFYWLSPILLYISYIHGQLDIIPISLLFGALFFLFKEKFLAAFLLLAMALATKMNILIIYPFFIVYLVSKNVPWKQMSLLLFYSLALFLFFNAPYLLSHSFLDVVLYNKEQNKIFTSFISLNKMTVYMIPSALMILFVRACLIKIYSRDIFLIFLGFSFSFILLFIPPMQGWYFWILPFLCYFYIKEEGRSRYLFLSLQAFYILYFLTIEKSDFIYVFHLLWHDISIDHTLYNFLLSQGIDAQKTVNITFTLLQTSLLINCFWIYHRGFLKYKKHKILASPFLIGIGGNSGVGKTTLSAALQALFTPNHVTILRGDDMHKWERGHEKWNELTHLDPKANYLHKEIDFLKSLRTGRPISRRHYDHTHGKFTKEHRIIPKNIIIFEGLLPFYLKIQRKLFDLKIFIKPETNLMYHWKIIRDREKRGYSKEKIIESIQKRDQDSKDYIEKQFSKADITIEVIPKTEIQDLGSLEEKLDLYYRLTLTNDVYIDPLIDSLSQIPSLNIRHKYKSEDQQEVILDGMISQDILQKNIQDHIEILKDLGINTPTMPDNAWGAILLILIYFISKMDNTSDYVS